MANEDPQSGMFDHIVTDEAVVEAAATLVRDAEAAKRYNRARAQVKQHIESLNLKDEQRVRVGSVVYPTRRRAGGGFSVDSWEKVTVDLGKPELLNEV